MENLVFITGVVTVGFALVSARLERSILTPPMVFTGIGAGLSLVLRNLISEHHARISLEVAAECTLVIVLFIDASRIRLPALFRDYSVPVRLLGVGLPLTVLFGAIVAKAVIPSFSLWEAALLAAILAPTDAALGQAVVSSLDVPLRIRQSLNVESGLNDGIVLPLVMLFAALAATGPAAAGPDSWLGYWSRQVILGPVAGVLVGWLAGAALVGAGSRGWMRSDFTQLSGAAMAGIAWSGALLIGGNGFIAAFVAGLMISCFADELGDSFRDFGEAQGQLLGLTTFLLFGMFIVVPALQSIEMRHIVYAAASLTVIRVIPVFISMKGLKFQLPTILFLGWFGPRGLASMLFALLVVERYNVPHGEEIMTISVVTVLLSMVLHGMTAAPGARWYAAALKRCSADDSPEHDEAEIHRPKFRNVNAHVS